MHDAGATATAAQDRIAQLERDNAALTAKLAATETSLARVRQAYTRALEQLALLRRRLFLAKAERRDPRAEQLAFDTMFAEVEQLRAQLGEAAPAADEPDEDAAPEATAAPSTQPARRGHGRRDLADSTLPEVRVEVTDPALDGVAERIGVEESWRLGDERGGFRRVRVVRVVDKTSPTTAPSAAADASPTEVTTAALPKELFRRCLFTPAAVAHLLVAKYMLGVPFYRLEQKLALEGAALDRATMCRYAEDAGATLGAIVQAARDEAFATAFCLSTDATGVSIQPGPVADKGARPCRKGHFFVVLADRDHVFFEYQPKHISAAVCDMFRGFERYLQADAHAVYDALFRGSTPRGQPPDPSPSAPPTEVGRWSHARRNFWEAAVCKHPLGVEGLRRADAIFAAEARLGALPPAQRKVQRDRHVRPLVEVFFAWVAREYAVPRERGLVATALGYAVRQREPLCRFLDDGRLRLENNASERALRTIATGRKSWLFFGSDDHASAAANLFSLIASCKLHAIDPEGYLADVIRVMPYWPRERYLELAPKYWIGTRARLDRDEMDRPLGHVTVPAEEKTATS